MKISCIIPTRNRSQLTVAAIESVLNQSIQEIEIVVVDDASSDASASFLRNTFTDMKIVSLPTQVGPGIARNFGVNASQGEIIMFLDSDDRWLPHHVEKLLQVIDSGFEFSYGTTLTRNLLDGNEFLIPEAGLGESGDCLPVLAKWCFLVPSSVAITRYAFEKVGGFTDDSFGEDWIFFVKLAERFPFGFSGPDPITIRNLHEGSLCSLSMKGAITHAIRRVGSTLQQSSKNDSSYVQRFQFLEKWAMEKEAEWNSVQDWYCAMKNEGMI